MACKLGDIIDSVKEIIPSELSEDWDNSGLQIGDRNWLVEKIWVALDPLPEVIGSACQDGVGLVITHHPLIFKPLANIDVNTFEGSVIQQALAHRVAVFSAHTNLDKVQAGVNDVLAARIGLSDIFPLTMDAASGKPGFGRVGELVSPLPLYEFAHKLKKTLNLAHVKMAGNLEMDVRSVAVCSGSGSSMIPAFLESGADAFVSGDLRYHDARMFEFVRKALIDIGHFASEHLIVESLADRLKHHFESSGLNLLVEAYPFEKDPFVILSE